MLPIAKNSNKANATVLDMLTHQARFQPWIPFYKATLDSLNRPSTHFYRSEFSEEFPTPVANKLFLIKDYNDTIVKTIIDSDLLPKKQYKYKRFLFYFIQRIFRISQ